MGCRGGVDGHQGLGDVGLEGTLYGGDHLGAEVG